MNKSAHPSIITHHSKVYVAGHNGLVGAAIIRRLQNDGYTNIITRTSSELNLEKQTDVREFFNQEKPEHVFLAAAKVGGILANDSYPADFIFSNLNIQNNVIDSAYRSGVKKLLFLGSSCIYPRDCQQPMKEEYLMTGPLELTNECYATAKIAGIKMCQAYRNQYGFNAISVMPTNLYGSGDNFDLQTSHVLPALIRKFHEAKVNSQKQVVIWGTGTPRREFLHVDDLADASLYLMQKYDSGDIINIGAGRDISIAELAELIGEIVAYGGDQVYDKDKQDGTPRKLLDTSRLSRLGWRNKISLREGVTKTYQWALNAKIFN